MTLGSLGLTLSIVFPAFNEGANIASSIAGAIRVLDQLQCSGEIIVVDDGSTDNTARVVSDLMRADSRIRLFQHPSNCGYGAALLTGFQNSQGKLVFFTDSDLQFDIQQLPEMLAYVDGFDIVMGFRAVRQDPFYRRLNAWAWRGLVNHLFDLQVEDINCAFKVFHRTVLDTIEIRSTGAFVNTEILAKARAAGFRLKELPVDHFSRQAGTQTGGSPSVILRAFVELSQLYWTLRRTAQGSGTSPRTSSARKTSLANAIR